MIHKGIEPAFVQVFQFSTWRISLVECTENQICIYSLFQIFQKFSPQLLIFNGRSFWVVVVGLVKLIITLIIVKTGNKDYCLGKKARRKKHKNPSRSRLKKFFMYLQWYMGSWVFTSMEEDMLRARHLEPWFTLCEWWVSLELQQFSCEIMIWKM